MNSIDISWPITPDMTAYKNKKRVQIEQIKTMEHDQVRETVLHLGSHAGTHVDAPAHFMHNGDLYDVLSISLFIGQCVVLDLMHIQDHITAQDLQSYTIPEKSIVLLKTSNSFLSATAPFNDLFVYLDASGADYLIKKHIKSVGIDYLGIERNQPNHETHITLMQHGIGIIEGLRLQHVTAGAYMLYCLPLAMVGTEASPARAILVQ